MAQQLASLVERLVQAESPITRRNWGGSDGYYAATCRLSAEDVPNLVDIV